MYKSASNNLNGCADYFTSGSWRHSPRLSKKNEYKIVNACKRHLRVNGSGRFPRPDRLMLLNFCLMGQAAEKASRPDREELSAFVGVKKSCDMPTPKLSTTNHFVFFYNTSELFRTTSQLTGTHFVLFYNTSKLFHTPTELPGIHFVLFYNTSKLFHTPTELSGTHFVLFYNTSELFGTPTELPGIHFVLFYNTSELLRSPSVLIDSCFIFFQRRCWCFHQQQKQRINMAN